MGGCAGYLFMQLYKKQMALEERDLEEKRVQTIEDSNRTNHSFPSSQKQFHNTSIGTNQEAKV